jgi:chromosome segregation ATPase
LLTQDLARDRDVREAAVRREAASTGRVLEAVLRGSLREAEGAHALLRHAGAARRLAGAVAAGQAAMMQSALWRWHQAMFVGERLSRQTLEARAAGLQERTTMLLGRALSRLPDALSRAALPLVAAVQRWRAAVAAISHGESLASRADLEARLGMVSTRLASATFDSQASASQADERVAALQRDLSEASGRLQQLMSERRNAQDALATLERERGGLGSLLQQAQAELATAQAAVEAAALKREQVAREKDVLWRELHSREAKSKSEIENEHTARLHGEALRLRAQLEASEREREALLSNAATASKLQATLHAHAQQHELFAQQQQAAARSAYLARAVTLQHTPGYGVYPSPTQPSDWMLRSQSRYQVSFPLD